MNTCESCKYFRQHYVKSGYRYSPILYGHCVYPKLKKRDATTAACAYYKEREKK